MHSYIDDLLCRYRNFGVLDIEKNVEELTLFLMYLTSWEEDGFIESETGGVKEAKIKTCWKGYSFEVINKLIDERFLYMNGYKSKSVTLTPKGEELARKLIDKYLK